MLNPFQKMLETQLGGMQERLQQTLEELAGTTVEASAGGGMVTAQATGNGELIEVIIDPAVVSTEDIEMLQDLITVAVREVMRKAAELKKEKIMQATPLGQFGIEMPDLF
jgi:DNA-binding YbaB/EbfC family protein